MSHYHLRSKVGLDLVDHVVDPGDVLVTFFVLFRRYAITFSDSCRIDQTVLASFHLVAGKLPPSYGRTFSIVWSGGSNYPYSPASHTTLAFRLAALLLERFSRGLHLSFQCSL
jgi:hypothetical protein